GADGDDPLKARREEHVSAVIPGGGDDETAARAGVGDGSGERLRGQAAAQAEVEDTRPVVHGIENAGGYVIPPPVAILIQDADGHQGRFPGYAGDTAPVVRGSAGNARDVRAMVKAVVGNGVAADKIPAGDIVHIPIAVVVKPIAR